MFLSIGDFFGSRRGSARRFLFGHRRCSNIFAMQRVSAANFLAHRRSAQRPELRVKQLFRFLTQSFLVIEMAVSPLNVRGHQFREVSFVSPFRHWMTVTTTKKMILLQGERLPTDERQPMTQGNKDERRLPNARPKPVRRPSSDGCPTRIQRWSEAHRMAIGRLANDRQLT